MCAQLTVPVLDTNLHVVDTPGPDPALVFINGGFATLRAWRAVIARLAGSHRTIQFDARGRGKSGTSSDYSVQAAVDDIGAVLQATDARRPILVGWSHGATTAVRYAAQHPDQVAGLVLVDGAYPIAMFDEAGKERVRAQFQRLGWIMRILAAFGRAANMSPAESAQVVIEMDAVNGSLAHDFASVTCPTVFVVGTGAHAGATDSEMATVRSTATETAARNANVSTISARANHTSILSKSPGAVVDAIQRVVNQAA
jgi:pimeloyl-ACP methyl ester carboxylesterase